MIAENYYSGLCVGGPKDGEYIQHTSRFIEFAKQPDWKFAVSLDVAMTSPLFMTYKIVCYEHVVGLRSGSDRDFHIDFWVDKKDFPTVESILRHVFGEYAVEKRKGRR